MAKGNARRGGMLLAQVVIPASMGGLALARGHLRAAVALWAVAALFLVSGLFIPALHARLDAAGRAVGRAFATALTWVLLVPVFLLVFVPGRLVLKLRGVDPLTRRFPSAEPTYWVPRKPAAGDDDYKRQF